MWRCAVLVILVACGDEAATVEQATAEVACEETWGDYMPVLLEGTRCAAACADMDILNNDTGPCQLRDDPPAELGWDVRFCKYGSGAVVSWMGLRGCCADGPWPDGRRIVFLPCARDQPQ